MRTHGMATPLLFYLLFCLLPLPVTLFQEPEPPVLPPDDGIRTSREFTVQQLVQDIFVKGGCKNISNIRGIGNAEGIGYFENGKQVIGLEKGILISTGHLSNAQGPNEETDKSGDFGDANGDRDLNQLASAKVYDAVGLEFDFVPLDSLVTFRYVFASEEYCEYVGSKFNDVFGFFVSGPGINGGFEDNAENVALIPGSGDYVAINSVNHRRNEEFYVSNELEDDTRTCNKPYTPTNLQSLIEFDGFTREFTATLKLIPCETYHLRLVVGDVNDNLFDSAVFLEAESFNIGGEVTVSAQATLDAEKVFEGCPNGEFIFHRVDTEDLSRELQVNFLLNPTSTAIEGVDFDSLPRSVIIPAGEMSASMPVIAISDQLEEDSEKLLLELDFPCDCVTGEATMILADAPVIGVEIGEMDICPGGTASLRPQISGGTAPYTYRWSTSDTAATLEVAPEIITNYQLTVTDACGQQAVGRTQVRPIDPARAVISGDQRLCPGEEGRLEVRFSGEPPWQFNYAIDGADQGSISGITENPFPLTVRKAGTYTLTSFRDAQCLGLISGSGQVVVTRLKIEAEPIAVSCDGLSDGRVNVVVSGGDLPYIYQWDQNMGERKNLQNVPAGLYTLTVRDVKGCEESKQVQVPSPTPIEPVTFDCLDLGSDSLAFRAGGGTPPYRFSVDGTNFGDISLLQNLNPGSLYNLVIRDAEGCRLEQEFIMPANTEQYVTLPNEVTVTLGQSYALTPQLLIPNSLVDKLRWTPAANLTCMECLQPTLAPKENSTYTLRVTDRFGCWYETSIIVNVNRKPSVFIPTVFSPNNDGHNDKFIVFADQDQVRQIRSFRIFTRWGNLLYEAREIPPNHPDFGWDGRFRGKWQDPGVYVYTLEIELVNGNTLMETGDVVLMR